MFARYLRAARIFGATAARCLYRLIAKYVYYWSTQRVKQTEYERTSTRQVGYMVLTSEDARAQTFVSSPTLRWHSPRLSHSARRFFGHSTQFLGHHIDGIALTRPRYVTLTSRVRPMFVGSIVDLRRRRFGLGTP